MSAGKGCAPRNNWSEQFRENYERIEWGMRTPCHDCKKVGAWGVIGRCPECYAQLRADYKEKARS